MYCQTCGAEIIGGLKYCNRCGANQFADKTAPANLFGVILTITGAIVVVVIGYLLLLSFFASEILNRGNVSAEVYIFLSVFTLFVFGIEALLIRQLSRLLSVYLETSSAPPNKPREMSSGQTAERLLEPQQTPAHVAPTRPIVALDTNEMTRTLPTQEATRKLETTDE